VLTLLAAMPPAINTFMLALEFGADGDEVAATVIVSTLLSVLTITVVLVLLARLGVA
jgi:predicted permease